MEHVVAAETDLAELKRFYGENGYAVARGLFSPTEAEELREHYMRLRAAGEYAGDFAGVDLTSKDKADTDEESADSPDEGAVAVSSDPLARYPRMIHISGTPGRKRRK